MNTMPKKLIVLVALMGIQILLRTITMATVTSSVPVADFIGLLINVALLVGVLKGNEGVRALIIIFSVIGLILGSFALLRAQSLGLHASNLLLFVAVVFSMLGPAFTIWCLTRADVKNWMSRRTFGLV